jgi:hypothetical protein
MDLVVVDMDTQEKFSTQCVFGYLDFSENHAKPLIDLAEGSYDLVIANNVDFGDDLGTLAVGDWNHDGVDDLAVGDPFAYEPGYIAGGTVYVFWGGDRWQGGGIIDLANDQADIFIHSSDMTSFPRLGVEMTTLDINNDGIDDLAVGAQFGPNQTGNGTGAVYVIYGSKYFTEPLVVDIAQGHQDLTLQGKEGADWFGNSLAVGDVNGDQVDDLVVGAGKAWRDDARYGAMYAFFGSDSFPAHHLIDLGQTEADVTVVGTQQYSYFGQYVTCGDFNGDGLDDMCGGQYSYDDEKYSARGAAYLIWGREDFAPWTLIDLRSEPADVSFYGDEMEFSGLGRYATAGELNGDGMDELCLMSWQTVDNTEPVSGATSIFLGTDNFPPQYSIDLSESYPSLKFLGDDYGDAESGLFCAIADINMDGYNDIVIGHGYADRPEAINCGAIYIFYYDGLPIDRPPRILAGPGPDAGNPPELQLWDPFYNAAGWSESFNPFLVQGFGLNPAAGDLDGDGYDEILAGPGPGPDHPPIVLALNSAGDELWQFQAYGTPRYGVNVTAGDLNGDGNDEVVTGAGPGDVYGPHVRGWMLSDDQIVPLGNVSFLAYGTHRWGVNVACGDIDGDGYDEIITGAGPGDVFGPHVRGWNVDGGTASPMPGVSFLAYGTPRWGVNVTCGDIDGDGIDEIVTGPGPSELFGSHVRGWNCDGGSVTAIPGVNFFPFPNIPNAMGCVVACGDLDNDHIDEILTLPGPHPDNPARLKSWNYDGDVLTQIERMSFMVFEEGPYVAGAKIAFGNFYQDPPFLP